MPPFTFKFNVMKKKTLLFSSFAYLSLIILVGTSSCKKNNNSTNDSTSVGTVTASISGKAYQSTISTGVDDTNNGLFNIVTAQVKGGDSISFDLAFPDTLSVNKPFHFGGFATGATVDYTDWKTPNWYTSGFGSNAGGNSTVTITSLDKYSHNLQGTFSAIIWYDSSDSLIVNSGKFNVNYQVK